MGDIRSMNLEWERWPLTTPQKMCACMIELVDRGYRALARGDHTPDGSPLWLLEIGTDQPLAPVLANLGQVIVLVGTRLEALTKEEYLAVYGDTYGA